MENIGIIGAGYVGLVTGACLSALGHNVTCADRDANLIWRLQQEEETFYEPALFEMANKCQRAGRLKFTTSIEKALSAEVIFIAVGMSARLDGSADMRNFEAAVQNIASASGNKTIVLKSTVPVGTARKLQGQLLRSFEARGESCVIAVQPEFFRRGSAVHDALHPSRMVIGCESDYAWQKLTKIYGAFIARGCPVIRSSFETAEMSKYAANSFLALKIAYANEVASVCDSVKADARQVLKIIGMDSRIGQGGLYYGLGFGGARLPRDTRFLARLGRQAGVQSMICETVLSSNERQISRAIGRIEQAMTGLRGKRITILGLSAKPESDVLRGSTSIAVARELWRNGADLCVHDPVVLREGMHALGLSFDKGSSDVYDAARDSDALLLLTAWKQYFSLDALRLAGLMRNKTAIDFKSGLNREELEREGFRCFVFGN